MFEVLLVLIMLLVLDYWHCTRQYRLIKQLRKVCESDITTDEGFKNGLRYAIEQIEKF